MLVKNCQQLLAKPVVDWSIVEYGSMWAYIVDPVSDIVAEYFWLMAK